MNRIRVYRPQRRHSAPHYPRTAYVSHGFVCFLLGACCGAAIALAFTI